MKLEELMNQYYPQLNENDKALCTQILADKAYCATCTSEQLAAYLHISRATLLRLCRKIGLVSFSDLKVLLQDEETRSTASECDIYDAYHALLDELRKFSYRKVCEVLYTCETIYVYGTGNEQKTLAEECKRIFLAAGKCVIDLFDYGELSFMKHSFTKRDVFLIISLSGETLEGIRILQALKDTGIRTISITRLANNTISTLCDHSLYVATQVVENEGLDYELVSAFYVLLDLLFINYLDYCNEVAVCE